LAINIEDSEVKDAESGDNVRLRVKGVEEEDVMVGFVACSASSPVKATTAFQAQLVILNIKSIMAPGFKAVLHIHSCTEEVVIESFAALIDKKTGEKMAKKPFVRQGDIVIANLSCQGIVCLEPFSVCDPMGRFTLRDEGKTIAVGKVMKVLESAD
jgi:peptide chain release factor subunit 3